MSTLLLWIGGGLFFLLLFSSVTGWLWVPDWLERYGQRLQLAERVQLAGGWDAIRRESLALAEQNPQGFDLYCARGTNQSSIRSYATSKETRVNTPALNALRPFYVQYKPRQGCIRMMIFGMHSTGLPDPPYFGLEIDTTTNTANYLHRKRDTSGDVTNKRVSVTNQIAEGIYEVY